MAKRYRVIVTRDTTESTVVDVEASSPEEANTKALAEARDYPGRFDWTPDDGVAGDPYLGDPDGVEEVSDAGDA